MTLEWYGPDGSIQAAEGVLENVSPHGFGIRTNAVVENGQAVWVTRPDSPALKSIVRHVERENGTQMLGFARILKERRREDRTPASGSGLLRLGGEHGETISLEVEIRNVSSEGVQVASPEPVPTNEVARLLGTAIECSGTVRYSVPWKGKFLVGVFLIGKVHSNSPHDESYAE